MRGKPHIYRHAGAWYCRRDIDGIRLLGIASDTPAIAFAAAATWHEWWRRRRSSRAGLASRPTFCAERLMTDSFHKEVIAATCIGCNSAASSLCAYTQASKKASSTGHLIGGWRG